MEESQPHLDATDELPVLSEEALGREDTPSSRAAPVAQDGIQVSLRDSLKRMETRWQALEERLHAQTRAIEDLARILGQADSLAQRRGAATAPASNLRFLPAASIPADRLAPADESRASGSSRSAWSTEPVETAREAELRQQLASLEAYIDGRAGHWRTMESELERLTRRIAELEDLLAIGATSGTPGAHVRHGGDGA